MRPFPVQITCLDKAAHEWLRWLMVIGGNREQEAVAMRVIFDR